MTFLLFAVAVTLSGADAPFAHPGREDAHLARLFTARTLATRYRVLVVDEPIATVLAYYRTRQPNADRGAWQPGPLAPHEAFGAAAPYDRARVARLYGGRRPTVARGAIIVQGRVVESVTLMSPYPDSRLTRLVPGTLVIVFQTGRKATTSRSAVIPFEGGTPTVPALITIAGGI